MDVPKINLLQSAERLLQEKRNVAQEVQSVTQSASVDQAQFSSILSSKYITIQNRLKEEQNELTKTQTKLGILDEEPGVQKEGLINILFGKTPLFEELRDLTRFDRDDLVKQLNAQKDERIKNIRSLEVEFTNVLSAGMVADPEKFSDTFKKISEDVMKPIPEKVVEKLIKD